MNKKLFIILSIIFAAILGVSLAISIIGGKIEIKISPVAADLVIIDGKEYKAISYLKIKPKSKMPTIEISKAGYKTIKDKLLTKKFKTTSKEYFLEKYASLEKIADGDIDFLNIIDSNISYYNRTTSSLKLSEDLIIKNLPSISQLEWSNNSFLITAENNATNSILYDPKKPTDQSLLWVSDKTFKNPLSLNQNIFAALWFGNSQIIYYYEDPKTGTGSFSIAAPDGKNWKIIAPLTEGMYFISLVAVFDEKVLFEASYTDSPELSPTGASFYRLDTKTGEVVKLFDQVISPRVLFSPDKKKMLFEKTREGKSNLAIYFYSTGQSVNLGSSVPVSNTAWLNEKEIILFDNKKADQPLSVLNLDTNESKILEIYNPYGDLEINQMVVFGNNLYLATQKGLYLYKLSL